MRFAARWPDGSVHTYYSPSLVVREYLEPGAVYALPEFLDRARTALRIASERVEAKYGFACSRAAATLAQIETQARNFAGTSEATVSIEGQRDHADAAVRIEAQREHPRTAGSARLGGGMV